MYKLTINGKPRIIAEPSWIKRLYALGKPIGEPISTVEAEATGVYFGGKFYTLLDGEGDPLMEGGFETAELELYDDTVESAV